MDCAIWRLPNNTLLELIQYIAPPPARVDMETYNVGNAHLCLETEDIEVDYARLRGHASSVVGAGRDPVGPLQGRAVCAICATRTGSPSSSCSNPRRAQPGGLT